MPQVHKVYDLLTQFREAQKQGHKTSSLDCQRRLWIGWYDHTAKEWWSIPLTIVQVFGFYESFCDWEKIGFANFSEVKTLIFSGDNRRGFFGPTDPDVFKEMECLPPRTPADTERLTSTILGILARPDKGGAEVLVNPETKGN